MLAYIIRRVLVTIPLMAVALYLVYVGVSYTSDPRADFYLCLPRCQDGFDAITAQYNLDQSIWLRPFSWFANALQGGFRRFLGYQCYNGFRDNIVGTGRDDASDAIDRRVEFSVVPCS